MQHAAMVPASVLWFMYLGILSCSMPGIICNEKAGARTIYTCLPGVVIDNKAYMPQLYMASAQRVAA